MSYAYLFGVCVLGVVWAIFFFLRKDLRKQQVLISILSAPLAPISQVLWFHHDYWRPPYALFVEIQGVPVGIEELFFAFFISGIGSVAYQVIFRKRIERGWQHSLVTIAIVGLTVVAFLVLKLFNFNTIWASTDALLLGTLMLVAMNRRLMPDALISVGLVLILTYPLYWALFFIFPDAHSIFWVSGGLSGTDLLGAPLEEMTWFVAWAAFSGILYESWVNVQRYISLDERPAASVLE